MQGDVEKWPRIYQRNLKDKSKKYGEFQGYLYFVVGLVVSANACITFSPRMAKSMRLKIKRRKKTEKGSKKKKIKKKKCL